MPTVEERFWAKVQKTDGCWLWTGCCIKGSYGRFFVRRGLTVLAHRFAYELLVGPIPEGHLLDHRPTCPRNCVRPDHVRPATQKQNGENRVSLNRNNTSGYQGVTPTPEGRWKARVWHNNKQLHVGHFDTPEEAAEAARLKRLELFTHNDRDQELAYS